MVPLLTNKYISLIVRGRLYSSCVRSSMLHGNDTWPVRKENEVALQWAEMRMVRWTCGIKLQDRVSSKELRGRPELHPHNTHNRFTALWNLSGKTRVSPYRRNIHPPVMVLNHPLSVSSIFLQFMASSLFSLHA